jgi:hypothetical protein
VKPIVSISTAWGFLFAPIFLGPVAYTLTSAACHILRRGNFPNTALDGTVTIYAAATHPAIYWKTVLGVSLLAAILDIAITSMIAIAAYTFVHMRGKDPRRI